MDQELTRYLSIGKPQLILYRRSLCISNFVVTKD